MMVNNHLCATGYYNSRLLIYLDFLLSVQTTKNILMMNLYKAFMPMQKS